MRVEILGQERRRRWGDEQKLDIVMSVGVSGATVTEVAHRHDVRTIKYVAEILGEDPELLRAIVSNDDNLTYGSVISVYNGEDESIIALTDDGMEELEQMLSYARRSTQEWNDFLDSFVDDEELIARIKAKSPR
ncbi:TPA: transposase [Klebsiella pneumoniae]|nr:transposase [Klebsiella pneumoniae]HDK6042825.1 transposase [Klebsiella pneumoniae]